MLRVKRQHRRNVFPPRDKQDGKCDRRPERQVAPAQSEKGTCPKVDVLSPPVGGLVLVKHHNPTVQL